MRQSPESVNVTRLFPLAVLGLMLIAAIAAMGVGVFMAREERVVVIEQDPAPLADFAAKFRREVDLLEDNFERTLITLRSELNEDMSDQRIASICETFVGVRQVAMVHPGRFQQKPFIERVVDLVEGFPLPGLRGVGVDSVWLKGPRGIQYFATKGPGTTDRVMIFGIDEAEVIGSMSQWLKHWKPGAENSLVQGEWSHQLRTPKGEELAGYGAKSGEPRTVFPINSRVGAWQFLAWNQTDSAIAYREPVLVASGVIAVIFAMVGLGSFVLLRRSLALATQRVTFVNQVSHELRTPLTNIMLNLDLAADAVEGFPPAEKRLGLVREELSRLHRLLENVLTFSQRKNCRSQLEPRKMVLLPEIERVLDQNHAALLRRGIAVSIDGDATLGVLADRDALAQILENLISNVVKYGGENCELAVNFCARAGSVVLRICDTGPGIPGRGRERIFRPFVRLSNRIDEGVSGSGLGLAISRDLAMAMEGNLTYLDRDDGKQGSCFELILPGADRAPKALTVYEAEAS